MINYIIKGIINTKPDIECTIYKDNASKTKINYGDKNKTNYRDFEDVDLKIIHNNIFLYFSYLAKNPIPKDILNIVEFNIIKSSLLANSATTINKKFL